MQGHHRDSAALYSRNDVLASLDVQHSISKALASGWRAERSIARGGQVPIPEPPFCLPSGAPLFSLPAAALLQGSWKVFAMRHEALVAEQCPATTAYASQAQPTQPEDELSTRSRRTLRSFLCAQHGTSACWEKLALQTFLRARTAPH